MGNNHPMMEFTQYSNDVKTYHLTPRDNGGVEKPISGVITATPNWPAMVTATVSGTDITLQMNGLPGDVDVILNATDVYGLPFTDLLRMHVPNPPPPPAPANHFTAVQDPPFVP